MAKKKILIVDDHPIIAKGLVAIINDHDSEIECFSSGNYKQAVVILSKNNIDLVLLDIGLPDVNGIKAISLIKNKFPSVKIIIQSMMDEKVYESKCLSAGAFGYVKKESACEELIFAIQTVFMNKVYFSPEALQDARMGSVDNKLSCLSSQEFQVLFNLGRGLSNIETADLLQISSKTVSSYKTRVLKKLNLANSIELVRFCVDNKIC